MKGANLVEVLAGTLNPSTTQTSQNSLLQMKSIPGFSVQLLVISDDSCCDFSIRQAALVYLKNLIQDHCESPEPYIPVDDL